MEPEKLYTFRENVENVTVNVLNSSIHRRVVGIYCRLSFNFDR